MGVRVEDPSKIIRPLSAHEFHHMPENLDEALGAVVLAGIAVPLSVPSEPLAVTFRAPLHQKGGPEPLRAVGPAPQIRVELPGQDGL